MNSHTSVLYCMERFFCHSLVGKCPLHSVVYGLTVIPLSFHDGLSLLNIWEGISLWVANFGCNPPTHKQVKFWKNWPCTEAFRPGLHCISRHSLPVQQRLNITAVCYGVPCSAFLLNNSNPLIGSMLCNSICRVLPPFCQSWKNSTKSRQLWGMWTVSSDKVGTPKTATLFY